MALYLAIDLGSSEIAALVFDAAAGQTLAVETRPTGPPTPGPPGRSEWPAERLVETALAAGRAAIDRATASRPSRELGAVAVTGQMHGCLLVRPDLTPATPFVGWQDRRADEPGPDGATTVERIRARLAGALGAERAAAVRIASGYMGATLVWLDAAGARPAGPLTAAFLPDYLVARLTARPPSTDPTNAAGSGLLDVASAAWDGAVVAALGIEPELLPPVRPTGQVVGGLAGAAAAALGLPAGLPVVNALGDNQASFLGAVADPDGDLLVNVGTGGQVSATAERPLAGRLIETRPLVAGSYLIVGAGLAGGRAYAALHDFVAEIGPACFGVAAPADLYERLNALAAESPPGADGLRFDPRFEGSRDDPARRASVEGLSRANFRVGHLVRGLLEGTAAAFRAQYDEMLRRGVQPRRRVVGAGNGVRRNPLLAALLGQALGLPLVRPLAAEEAAFGAALLASVASGERADLADARRLIRYQLPDGGG